MSETNYRIDSVHEALGVLMHVAQFPGLGVTELSKRSGNTKARTFRFLYTLEQAGFVQRGPTDTQYILGHATLILGLAAQEQVSLAQIGYKHLRELGARFNENTQIRIREGQHSVIVCKWNSTQGVRVHTEVGSRRPLHAGASSKVLLAYAPSEVQNRTLTGTLERYTPHTLTQGSQLAKEIKLIRSQGYAVSLGEVFSDLVAISAPIFDAQGAAFAAIGMSIPTGRAPSDMSAQVAAIRATARSISLELGWRVAEGESDQSLPLQPENRNLSHLVSD